MDNYTVGYLIGSLSVDSMNRTLSKALIRLAPDNLAFPRDCLFEIFRCTTAISMTTTRRRARALKEAIAAVDALLFVTPEYNRGVPGVLKNAIDWASRPYGTKLIRA